MMLDQDQNVCCGGRFDDGSFMKECLCGDRKYLVDFDDYISGEGSDDVLNLLPNDPFEMEFNCGFLNDHFGMEFNHIFPNDPFGMELNRSFPNDPFGMELNCAFPNDPFGMEFNCGFLNDPVGMESNHIFPNDPFGMDFNCGLPNDPFGMEFNHHFLTYQSGMDFNISLLRDPLGMVMDMEATVAAIAGWKEDYRLKAYELESSRASKKINIDDNKFFAKPNFFWMSFLEYEQEEGENVFTDTGSLMHSDEGSDDAQSMISGDNMEELKCFGCEKYQCELATDYNNGDEGAPPADGLFFVLGYLGVKDLLSVEMVCKSLRDAVQNDPLLWRSINIDHPLNYKISNDNLLRLTDRAQGTLCSLSLVRCLHITNAGLRLVLGSNPRLTKLSVPGCIKLKVSEVLDDLRAFNSATFPGIKHLRVSELFGLTNQHYDEFKLLLGVDDKKTSTNYKPRFYREGQEYVPLDDERVIDIENCPICKKARLVYDCPVESCQADTHSTITCRACPACISRCMVCGCCLDNKAYEETVAFGLECLDCLTDLLNSEEIARLSPRHTYFHQKASYHFFLYS